MMATFICHRCMRITVGYLCRCPPQVIDRREVVRGERVLIRPTPSRWERFKGFVRRLFGRDHLPKQKQNGIYQARIGVWEPPTKDMCVNCGLRPGVVEERQATNPSRPVGKWCNECIEALRFRR